MPVRQMGDVRLPFGSNLESKCSQHYLLAIPVKSPSKPHLMLSVLPKFAFARYADILLSQIRPVVPVATDCQH